jgi:hypothetical protein
VKQCFKIGAIIIFDKNPDNLTMSTKSAEHDWITRSYGASNVLFDEKMCEIITFWML